MFYFKSSYKDEHDELSGFVTILHYYYIYTLLYWLIGGTEFWKFHTAKNQNLSHPNKSPWVNPCERLTEEVCCVPSPGFIKVSKWTRRWLVLLVQVFSLSLLGHRIQSMLAFRLSVGSCACEFIIFFLFLLEWGLVRNNNNYNKTINLELIIRVLALYFHWQAV